MKPRIILPLFALLIAPALFAQVGTVGQEPEAIPLPDAISEPAEPNEPLVIVEEMPEFPGGQDAMMKYLSVKLKYPSEAIESNIEGTVFLSFVVEREGQIGDVKLLRGIGSGCDEEAMRVVKSMPKWKPGKQNGKTVRTQYNLPIRFKLQDPVEPKK